MILYLYILWVSLCPNARKSDKVCVWTAVQRRRSRSDVRPLCRFLPCKPDSVPDLVPGSMAHFCAGTWRDIFRRMVL